MLKISKVKRNSIASEFGLEIGDEILAFDGYPCEDELDYMYYCTLPSFSMTVKNSRGGEEVTLSIEKSEEEDLGLCFEKNSSAKLKASSITSGVIEPPSAGICTSIILVSSEKPPSFPSGYIFDI